jgi:hypothetical protein
LQGLIKIEIFFLQELKFQNSIIVGIIFIFQKTNYYSLVKDWCIHTGNDRSMYKILGAQDPTKNNNFTLYDEVYYPIKIYFLIF